jgi:hypothetical protein
MDAMDGSPSARSGDIVDSTMAPVVDRQPLPRQLTQSLVQLQFVVAGSSPS